MREGARSEYHPSPQLHHIDDPSCPIQIEGSQNPNTDPLPQIPRPNPKSNLSKSMGHLWRGAPSKSFAAAVRSESATIVSVKMFQGGGVEVVADREVGVVGAAAAVV